VVDIEEVQDQNLEAAASASAKNGIKENGEVQGPYDRTDELDGK
jgi:hypothetical protein